ncbi:hypothetical protein GQ54DRAFT_104349 [Martensiomyces pterosporus]|nr:hypothetical protein GQ54DRAFT_104349 [Martensiomyces pterosporus]
MQSVKHSGGTIMLSNCVKWEGVGCVTKIDCRMDGMLYLSTLRRLTDFQDSTASSRRNQPPTKTYCVQAQLCRVPSFLYKTKNNQSLCYPVTCVVANAHFPANLKRRVAVGKAVDSGEFIAFSEASHEELY